jgi:hypothetical protein
VKKSRFSEEQIIAILARAGGRRGDEGRLPSARHLDGDVLQLEGQVRRAGRERGEAAAGARGRERAAEEAPGRCDARPGDAEGAAWKKMVRPADKRASVARLQSAEFSVSERRACRVIGADRTSMRYRDAACARTRRCASVCANWLMSVGAVSAIVACSSYLRREGEAAGKNRIYRLYREEGLAVKKAARVRQARHRHARADPRRGPSPMPAGRSTSFLISLLAGAGSASSTSSTM